MNKLVLRQLYLDVLESLVCYVITPVPVWKGLEMFLDDGVPAEDQKASVG